MGKHSQIVPEGVHGFMFFDPGGTTGVSAAHIELKGTVKETLQTGVRMKKTAEIKGPWHVQGRDIYELVQKFMYVAQVEHGIPFQNLHFGFESYTRRPHAHDNNLEPVYVTACAVGMLTLSYPDMKFGMIEPSDAKGYATNDRLRLWDMWVVGSAHERDATRVLITALARLLG